MKLKLALVVILIVAALIVSGCCCCVWPSHKGSYRLPHGFGIRGESPAKATPSAPATTMAPAPSLK